MALGLIGLALFCLPAIVAFAQGWLALADGPGAGMERWTLFAVFYVGWALLLVIGFVWVNDRLGIPWSPHDRAVTFSERRRRRLDAGLRLLRAQGGASGSPRKRRARRP